MPTEEETIAAIKAHRDAIDQIDEQLVKLLNERASEALAIRALKPQAHLGLFDPKREEEIFERLTSYNHGPLYSDNLREIYEAILKVSKEMHS
jgi:chorismate mutase